MNAPDEYLDADAVVAAYSKMLDDNVQGLRDQFAMAAMNGMLFCPGFSTEFGTAYVAETSYQLADAMLLARKK